MKTPTQIGDEMQSALSRLADWVGDSDVPYEVWLAAWEGKSAVDDWTEVSRATAGDVRYIVLQSVPYEGLELSEDEPLPTFATREEASEHATKLGLRSPKGRRNEASIVAVKQPQAADDSLTAGVETIDGPTLFWARALARKLVPPQPVQSSPPEASGESVIDWRGPGRFVD